MQEEMLNIDIRAKGLLNQENMLVCIDLGVLVDSNGVLGQLPGLHSSTLFLHKPQL